jgi:hypothetical protein
MTVSCSIRDAEKRHFRERASAVLRAIAARASRRRRANQAGMNHRRSAARSRSCAAVLFLAAFRYRPLRASVAWPKGRGSDLPLPFGGALRVLTSLAGLFPPRVALTFPPGRAHVPFAITTSPDLFSSGSLPAEVECLRRFIVRLVTWFGFWAWLPSAVRVASGRDRSCLGLFLLQGFGHARCVQSGGTEPLELAGTSESSVPGHRFRCLSAHGFSAPFQRRRFGDMHRLVHLPAA